MASEKELLASLAALRAHCGEPTMPLESCPICRVIPKRCMLDNNGGDDSAPAEVEKLETFMGSAREGIARCPTCHRLYYFRNDYESLVGSVHDVTFYTQFADTRALYNSPWAVSRRHDIRSLRAIKDQDFFRDHAIAWAGGTKHLSAIDEHNHATELTADTLAQLVAIDPPTGLEDPERAREYARFLSELLEPDVHVVNYPMLIMFPNPPASAEEHAQIEAVRAETLAQTPPAEIVGDDIVVRLWLVSKQRLIRRVMTLSKTGAFRCDDTVAFPHGVRML